MATRHAVKPASRTSGDRHQAITWLADRLAAVASVKRVLRFGSRTLGDQGTRSNIDLAVEKFTQALAALEADLAQDRHGRRSRVSMIRNLLPTVLAERMGAAGTVA